LGANRTARTLTRDGLNLVLGGRSQQYLKAPVVGIHLAKCLNSVHLVEAAVAFGAADVLLFVTSAPALGTLDLDARDRSVNVKTFLP
jgi:hypothetical protein